MPLELVTLAAGLGSRFGGAKQVEGFGPGGETIVELNAFDAFQAGVEAGVWVTRSELVPTLETLAEPMPWPIRITIQPRALDPTQTPATVRDRPWGTGHAWIAAGTASTPSLVLNADDLYGSRAIRSLCESLRADLLDDGLRPSAWVAGYRVSETLSPHGGVSRAHIDHSSDGVRRRVDKLVELADVQRDPDGRVRGATPEGTTLTLDDDALVSMNLWAFSGDWGPAQKAALHRFAATLDESPDQELRIPDIVFQAVEAGIADVFVLPVESRWAGVTFPEDRATLEALLLEFASGAYPTPLFSSGPNGDECS